MDGAVKCKVQTYTCISIWMEAWRLIKLHFVYNTVTCDLDGMLTQVLGTGRWHPVLANIRSQQNRKKKPLSPRRRSLNPWTASILFALTCFRDGCNRWAGKGQQPVTCCRAVEQDLDGCWCQPAKDPDDHDSDGSIPSAQSLWRCRASPFITDHVTLLHKQRGQKASSVLTILPLGQARAAAPLSAASDATFARPPRSDSRPQRFRTVWLPWQKLDDGGVRRRAAEGTQGWTARWTG